MAGKTPMAQPTEDVPADQPAWLGDARFGIGTESLGMARTKRIGAMHQFTDHPCWSLQREDGMVTMIANASSGRDDGAGGTALSSIPTSHRSRQCEQTPAISISGLFGANPAARDDALSASAAAPPGASPTAPQRSQMRKTTRSSPA